jgi:AcrR family transcriptional regulator
MEVFWELGYEGATLLDLQKAMGGISAPSFYAAFGSKETLFKEAVALHMTTVGACAFESLTNGPTARVSIEGMLRAAAAAFTTPGKPRGCMLVLGAMACSRENRGVQDYMRSIRVRRSKFIRQRLERGRSEGDVPKAADLAAMTTFYAVIADGLSIRARDGASRAELGAAIDCAMAAWDSFAHQRSSSRAARAG